MKILLLNLPWNVGGKKGVRAGSRWPHLKTDEERDYLPFPFFLAYTSSLLKQNKFDVHLIDAIAEDLTDKEFFERIKKICPTIILIETSTPSLELDLDYAKKIKKFLDTKIIFVGCDNNITSPQFLLNNSFIDFIIYGEYELPFLNLVKNLNNCLDLSKVSGLIYRNLKGRVMKNSKPELCNLDDLPWPDRGSVPIYKYLDAPGNMPLPCAQMLASRGCPYSCVFCAWPQLMYGGSNYRVRNVKDVVDEMEYLVKKKGFKSIYFDDDTFNIGKKRILELCGEIKKRGLNILWAMMARADMVDRELLAEMKSAGLYAVKYGVESVSQRLLDNMNKELDIILAEKNIMLTKQMGIKVHLTFTFGVQGENKRTIQDTIDFAMRMNPDSVQFSITTPFPGTSYFDMLKSKNQIISEKWSDYDGNMKSVIKTDELSPNDLEESVKNAYNLWKKRQYAKNTSISKYVNLIKKSFNMFKNNIKPDRQDILILIPPPYAIEEPLLAAAYLSTYLKTNGIRADILDLNIDLYHHVSNQDKTLWELERTVDAQKKEKILRFIDEYHNFIYKHLTHAIKSTEIVGFSVTIGNACFALELARIIKTLRPSTKIIFGGPYTFDETYRSELSEDIVDYIIVGEGEAPLLELTKRILDKKSVKDIPGVIINNRNDKKILVKSRPIVPLDSIPFPTFEEFDLNKYLRRNMLPISSSRGCINNCAFCSDYKITQHYRNMSAEHIFNAINMMVSKYNRREFRFLDLLCNGNIPELEKFCNLVIKNNLDISWVSYGAIRKEMTYKLMKKMREAKCHSIIFGLESGSDAVLKMMRKKYSVKDAEKVLAKSAKAGLSTAINLIIGFPGETEEHHKDTCDFLRRNAKNIHHIVNLSTCVLMRDSDIDLNFDRYNITKCLEDELYWTVRGNTFDIRNRRACEIIKIAKEIGVPIVIKNNIKEDLDYGF